MRFGLFELDAEAQELTRSGQRVAIQSQPLRLIALLAQRAGQLVTREELQQGVWASDTFVDFEGGLRTTLSKARQALGDDAANPRFIETVPRQGYRFIAPVSYIKASPAAPPPAPPGPVPPPVAPAIPLYRRPYLVLSAVGLLALLATVAVLLAGNRPSAPVLDRLRPFAAAHGDQARPAFSPSGEMLAFDWEAPQDRHTNIYIQRLDATSPLRLTRDVSDARRAVWSPDGRQVAYLRETGADTWGIFSAPVVGVEEHKWAEIHKGASAWLDWSPDGKWFAVAEPVAPNRSPSIVLISLATGERRTLTAPPNDWHGDSEPAFSPDSSQVAFRRTEPSSGVEDIYELPITGGAPTRLTFDGRTISAFAFAPDGGLLFSSMRAASIRSLWWKEPRGNRLQRVTAATVDAVTPAVSRDGRHFAFAKVAYDVNIWRINADGAGPATSLIDSPLPDTSPQFSPDGRRIAFHSTRLGTDAIWVCEADGSNPVLLLDGGGKSMGNPRWSPDGRQIAFEWLPVERAEIQVISSDGGQPRKLVADANENHLPAWSGDGRFLYFSAARKTDWEIFKVPAQGGAPIAVGGLRGSAASESPDGRFLYYFRADAVWRVPLDNGQPAGPEAKVQPLPESDWGNWVAANQGLYYLERRHGRCLVQYLDFATGSVRQIRELPKPPLYGSRGLALSPDGAVLLVAQVDQSDINIYVQ